MTNTVPVTRPTDAQAGPARLAFLLATASGCTDGIGASIVAGVFASFMSGNTTGAGIALGIFAWPTLARIGIAIPLYVLAVTVGALVTERWPEARSTVWSAVVALLATFVLLAHVLPPAPTSGFAPQVVPLLACLVVPMGLLNMTLRRVGGTTVGLGYVTGTLVSLGEAVAKVVRRGRGWHEVGLFAGLWLCFFAGAAVGAFAVARMGSWAAAVPATFLLALVVVDVVRNRARMFE